MLLQLGLLEAAQPLLFGTLLNEYDEGFCLDNKIDKEGTIINKELTDTYNERRKDDGFKATHDPISEALSILDRMILGPGTPEKNAGGGMNGGYSSVTAGISMSLGVATCVLASLLGAFIE